MVQLWNGESSLWNKVNKSITDTFYNRCCISDDRTIINIPALDVWLKTEDEQLQFIQDKINLTDLINSRFLAWTIPECYRKFFCRLKSGYIIPIKCMPEVVNFNQILSFDKTDDKSFEIFNLDRRIERIEKQPNNELFSFEKHICSHKVMLFKSLLMTEPFSQ